MKDDGYVVQLYTIYDKLAEEHASMFEAVNDAVAKRQFNNLMKKQDINPDDYDLVLLGNYNRRNAMIANLIPKIINTREE